MILCERPEAFWALLLVVPAVIYSVVKYSLIVKNMKGKNDVHRSAFVFRTVFRAIAWCFLVTAFAGISIGTNSVPVQKNGHSVCFVMDISYSMETRDAPQNMSRLEAAANYADTLLSHMEGSSVSVVLAKGSGILAVPVTEDFESIRSLLYSLSPSLMTSAGSSLGSGINCALNSFPEQSSAAPVIWLFTDGEETDDGLLSSLNDAVRYGIPVAIIGFGSERETEIFAGDGKTKVKTALRSSKIENVILSVKKKNAAHSRSSNAGAVYVDASQLGSARTLLKMLSTKDGNTVVSYELKPVARHNVFIALSLLFFVLSFIAGEFSLQPFLKKSSALICVLPLLLCGCSSRLHEGRMLLDGRLDWNKKDYPQAVANFLSVAEDAKEFGDEELFDYGVFGLASTYLSQGESDAALDRFAQISENCPDNIRFAVYYNSGIIAHQKGDYALAANMFKNALICNSESVDAKINLELAVQEQTVHAKTMENELVPLSENSNDQSLENAIYNVIRESDRNRWKSQEQPQERSQHDY